MGLRVSALGLGLGASSVAILRSLGHQTTHNMVWIEYWNYTEAVLSAKRRPNASSGSQDQQQHTNSATSFALPLRDSLWILDLSFSAAAGGMVHRCGQWIKRGRYSERKAFSLEQMESGTGVGDEGLFTLRCDFWRGDGI